MNEFAPSDLYGVIGFPLGHSLSPLLHTTGFRALGIPAVLVPWPMESDKLPLFVDAFRLLRIRGACVTIPHKEEIMPFLDRVSDRAKAVGAVNTLYWEGDELCGDNTDVPGLIAPLVAEAPAPGMRRVLLLGAGGAARAVVAGFRSLGYAEIIVANRSPAAAEALAAEFGLELCPWEKRGSAQADIVVNSTPLGMKGKYEGETPYPAGAFDGKRGIAYDIVYTPLRTRFLRDAEAAGWRTISGLEMFLAQADFQFRAWTGKALPEEAMRAVRSVLEAR